MALLNIHHGDNRELLKRFPDNSIDSCVTDPPYELRTSSGKGFMGQKWDGTGIAFDVSLWREILRVLRPGAWLLSFGGAKTYHRMACAVEDAGFEIRDQIQWLSASKMPHSPLIKGGLGTNLKPSCEPICLARKPIIGTVASNLDAFGTGALNIDACRVDGRERTDYGLTTAQRTQGSVYGTPTTSADFDSSKGRWPSNVIHDGSEEVLEVFSQFGESTSRRGKPRGSKTSGNGWGMTKTGAEYSDSGSPSRFFYCARATKSDRGEGNDWVTVKPTALMAYLCRLSTPPGGTILDPFLGSGSTGVAALREGFDFIGIDLDPHAIEIATKRLQNSESVIQAPSLPWVSPLHGEDRQA
jgi:DNA modification methylase